MYWSDIPRHPSRRTLAQFGALLTSAALALAVWRFIRGEDWQLPGGIAAVAGLVALVRPGALRWLFVGWMVAVFPIGWVVGRLLLAVAFFVVFLPTGLVMRAIGRDSLGRRRGTMASYWQPRAARDHGDYFRQY